MRKTYSAGGRVLLCYYHEIGEQFRQSSVLVKSFLNSKFSYRDQFSMLAENMARERYELECREKAQDKVRLILGEQEEIYG